MKKGRSIHFLALHCVLSKLKCDYEWALSSFRFGGTTFQTSFERVKWRSVIKMSETSPQSPSDNAMKSVCLHSNQESHESILIFISFEMNLLICWWNEQKITQKLVHKPWMVATGWMALHLCRDCISYWQRLLVGRPNDSSRSDKIALHGQDGWQYKFEFRHGCYMEKK